MMAMAVTAQNLHAHHVEIVDRLIVGMDHALIQRMIAQSSLRLQLQEFAQREQLFMMLQL
jgi:hypothetical protein